jgi:hypothetical protein
MAASELYHYPAHGRISNPRSSCPKTRPLNAIARRQNHAGATRRDSNSQHQQGQTSLRITGGVRLS